jgi:broad specificity phosphatase PhoE
MRYVELRRHTMRVKPGQHLSQAGVTLARRVGEGIGPFQCVITSTIPRAYETAIAMGFAVDEQLEELGYMTVAEADLPWDVGFALWAEAARTVGSVQSYTQSQAALIARIARALPDEGAALVVSHGGIVEAQTVGSLPQVDFSGWGPACDYCEGARLVFDGETFVRGDVLRVQGEK